MPGYLVAGFIIGFLVGYFAALALYGNDRG